MPGIGEICRGSERYAGDRRDMPEIGEICRGSERYAGDRRDMPKSGNIPARVCVISICA